MKLFQLFPWTAGIAMQVLHYLQNTQRKVWKNKKEKLTQTIFSSMLLHALRKNEIRKKLIKTKLFMRFHLLWWPIATSQAC